MQHFYQTVADVAVYTGCIYCAGQHSAWAWTLICPHYRAAAKPLATTYSSATSRLCTVLPPARCSPMPFPRRHCSGRLGVLWIMGASTPSRGGLPTCCRTIQPPQPLVGVQGFLKPSNRQVCSSWLKAINNDLACLVMGTNSATRECITWVNWSSTT